jgi:hypothetical protein
MLLSNITQQEEGSLALLMLDRPVLTGYHATKLLFFFTSSAETEKDYFGWLTNVFLNLSQTKQGREFLMSKENNFIKNLLPMLSHSNVLRKRGIAGVLRNCLFLKEEHNWLLAPEIDLLTHLVLPLIGGVDEKEVKQSGLDPTTLTLSAKDRFDDKERAKMPEKFRQACLEEGRIRESDLNTRRLLVECLFLLQAQRETRELLREKALYPIVRELHKFEKDEAVSNAIHDVVEMLIRDEEPEEQPQQQAEEGDLRLATITP